MCGIAGVVNSNKVTKEDVRAMIESIQYRGIDERGVEVVGPSIMAHARLAVVDPENGMQPMTNEDETVWVSFNGEIYNYVELREELKSKGHIFKSRCDTEVLVHLWEEEGEKMLDRLIGMFSFFIWDLKSNKGMLVRDRQGIKPCFIAEYEGGIAFCSEIKGILTLPHFKREINDDALSEVFSFNYVLPPHTCFKGVNHLEPGTYLFFDGDKKPVQKTYWQWPFFEEKQNVTHEEFETLIDDAVRLQMRFDVDGGLYLSGGVDSSVVAQHLKRQWKEPQINAVGLNFKEEQYSEFQYSNEIANLCNINLDEASISYEMIPKIIDKVSYHAEQPHGDFSFFLFYILARKANAEGKIVMFTGDGPDEVLLGFNHNSRFFHGQTRMNFSLKSYFDIICYMNDDMRGQLLSKDFLSSTKAPFEKFQKVLQPYESLEPAEQIAAYECTSLMPGNNLVKGDRMGAAWSTEGRAPFMDHRVAELFCRLPLKEKFNDGIGKFYLKEYASRLYPRQLIFKKKAMPTTPIGEWLKGPLYDWAYDILSSNTNERFNTEGMIKLLNDHKNGVGNYTRELRTLLMTQVWLKNYF